MGALRDAGPEQRLGFQASDGHRLAPRCLLPRCSAHGAQPQSAGGGGMGLDLSPQPTQPGQQKTAAAQSRGHLSSQVVLEDSVLNQKLSDPCPARAAESRKFPVGRAAARPLAARISSSGFSALKATLCTGRCLVREADERGHPSGDETGPAFRVSAETCHPPPYPVVENMEAWPRQCSWEAEEPTHKPQPW